MGKWHLTMKKNSFGHGNTTTSWEVSSIEQKRAIHSWDSAKWIPSCEAGRERFVSIQSKIDCGAHQSVLSHNLVIKVHHIFYSTKKFLSFFPTLELYGSHDDVNIKGGRKQKQLVNFSEHVIFFLLSLSNAHDYNGQ